MKSLIIIPFMIFSMPLTYGQGKVNKNEIGFSIFGSSLRNSENRFLILSFQGERKTKIFKNKLGLGLSIHNVQNRHDGNKDFAIGPTSNYHFLKSGKLDPYLGLSVMYSNRAGENNYTSTNVHLKYQYGIRYFFNKNFGFSFELSNYKFDGGLFPTNRQKRTSGVYPTLGLRVKL
ncbi:MAG: hypothetical protein IPP61_07075 [Cytophagaceae bacterium]|nr:hypothetical protein [Cytophagaceae bacterium]MBL0302107.1 hypothetical protein [Cytophagaceae bacterium]MBL0324928.1 hypothetical protein [Cytophagaceae bacterium]